MNNKEELWQCTICGRVGTVGRCCGMETRVRYKTKPKSKYSTKCEFLGKVRQGVFERLGCLALIIISAATILYVLKLFWEYAK